ncbi:MAG: class I SAM-dependent methyltransferase, partial [Actinomycetota bacterium]
VDGVACPVCGTSERIEVLDLPLLPVDLNSQVDPSAASGVDKGPTSLVACTGCSHLYNQAFDPQLIDYTASYENTLHYSEQFRAFANELADRLIERYDLVGETVVEVGCGPGHFLSMLAERGIAAGRGFDPSYDPERLEAPGHRAVTVTSELLGPDTTISARLAVSQHVLEHLQDPVGLLSTFRQVVGEEGAVYSEVPNGELMLGHTALWDLIYEHVSYFTPPSLRTALKRAGLDVVDGGTAFGDQFLWMDGRQGVVVDDHLPPRSEVDPLLAAAEAFGRTARGRLDAAADELARWIERGPVALWGAGTKGMTYLNLVAGAEQVAAVVDINPRKRGFGVPGTGLAIGEPSALTVVQPETVLIANPIYCDEISSSLAELDVRAEVVPLWS